MESLDTPTPTTQLYSDCRNSPVDSSLFNNKRDSAYSSFSASSNTSDYTTVPLRPGEACSMDNLLQSLGPSCRGYSSGDTATLGSSSGETPEEAQLIAHKSRSLTRPRPKPVKIKERPSSCCYEDERRRGDFEIIRNVEREGERKTNPPQPPTRKDSFRATRGCPNVANKHYVAATLESQSVSSHNDENKSSLNVETGTHNGFPALEDDEKNGNYKEDVLHSDDIPRQTIDNCHMSYDKSANTECSLETTSDNLTDPLTTSPTFIPSSCPGPLPAEPCVEVQEESCVIHTQNKHSSTGLHRHSAPEKLLATQLELLQFNSDSSSMEPYKPPVTNDCPLSTNQWSHSSLLSAREDQEEPHNYSHAHSNKYESSRSSTPGSVFFEGDGDVNECLSDKLDRGGLNGAFLAPVERQHPWGRSVSVPGDPIEMSSQGRLNSDQMVDRDFQPLSTAASVDTLLEEQRAVDRSRGEGKKEEETYIKKSNSSRNHRRNRRRSERFATNLRNEIQRKKAQLQRSHGPGGLLCSGETVQEEEGPELNEESDFSRQEKNAKVSLPSHSNPQDASTTAPVGKSNHDDSHTRPQSTTYTQSKDRSVQILDPGVPKFGLGIRVVEEAAPAGKARRWRWTPEHKLQPEPDRHHGVVSEQVLGITGSRHGVCAFTPSSTSSFSRSSSYSRIEESDILPFADRMKFFEETSKGMSAFNTSSLTSHKDKNSCHHPELQGELGQHPTQRRYSYQGGIQDNSLPQSTVEARRMSVSSNRERQREKDTELAREREERERERIGRLRERERQQEKERQEMELRMESSRQREIQQEREREERVRHWERERERELEFEREKEIERAREMELLRKERERELERKREKLREEDAQLISHQHFYSNSGIPERHEDFLHEENLHSFHQRPQSISSCQAQNQVSHSAFHPVNQSAENRQLPLQGFSARSYTATEVRVLLFSHLSQHKDNYCLNFCKETNSRTVCCN